MPNYGLTEIDYGLSDRWIGLTRFVNKTGGKNLSLFNSVRGTPSSDDVRGFRDSPLMFQEATSSDESAESLADRFHLILQDLLRELNRLDHASVAVVRETKSESWKSQAVERIKVMRSNGRAPYTIIRVAEDKPDPQLVTIPEPIIPQLTPMSKRDLLWARLMRNVGDRATSFTQNDLFRTWRESKGGNVRVAKTARRHLLNGTVSRWAKEGKITILSPGNYEIVERQPEVEDEDYLPCAFSSEDM